MSVQSNHLKTNLIVLTLVLLGIARPARGQDPIDQRVWTAVASYGRFEAGSPWLWAADAFLRARDGASTMDAAAVRVSVGRDLTRASRVAAGYAYGAGFLDGGGAVREHRLHQEYVWMRGVADLTLRLRSRLEERFIEGTGGMRLRVRQQVRLAWPIGPSGLQAVASDEVLVNATGSRGLDGNRVFVGVRRALTPGSAVEMGYLNLYTPSRSGAGRHSHVMTAVLVVAF